MCRHCPCRGGVDRGEPYTITCDGINLGCFYFILSVNLSCILGPITYDFDARTLSIQHNGRQVLWHADPGLGALRPATAVTAADAERPMLDRLLQLHAAIFDEPQ